MCGIWRRPPNLWSRQRYGYPCAVLHMRAFQPWVAHFLTPARYSSTKYSPQAHPYRDDQRRLCAAYLPACRIGVIYALLQADSKLPGIVHVAPGLSHSLHPDFYRHELSGSIDRLGGTAIDAYLVEHPEHHLALKLGLVGENVAGGAAPPSQLQLDEARGFFYEEMTTLFRAMEGRLGEGGGARGGSYGVSSLGLSLPTWDPMHVSWERLLKCAEQAASTAGRER